MSEIERRLQRLERYIWGSNPPPLPTLYCSFCGKSQDEVQKLIAGPKVLICDECTDLCTEIVAESRKPKPEPSA